ncbi:hypothetical protein SALBM135S_09665 [Streptomyces alboniger]
MGMFSVSAVIMISGARGSYALAGAVTATGLAATAVVAPWTARLVDRYGQARVAVPATLIAALGSLSLLLCVRQGAPDWTLFASYAATATTPNTGGMSRARWAHLLKGDSAALHTANSFEQAADELCFMLGPVLAAFLCGALFPQAGTLIGVVLLVTGVLLFAARRATEPPPRGRTDSAAGTRSPLRARGMPALLVVFLATGAVFGSLEVVTIAFADARGSKTAAGVVLALQAAGFLRGGARLRGRATAWPAGAPGSAVRCRDGGPDDAAAARGDRHGLADRPLRGTARRGHGDGVNDRALSSHGNCGDGGNRTRVERCRIRASPCAVRCDFLGPGDHANKSPTGPVTV